MQKYKEESISQGLGKKIILDFLDYLSFKVRSDSLTMEEVDSISRVFMENIALSGTKAAIDQVEAHKRVIASCDQLLLDLNPQLKHEQEQAGKIARLEERLAGMSDQIAALTGMLSKSLGGKKKED